MSETESVSLPPAHLPVTKADGTGVLLWYTALQRLAKTLATQR